MLLLPKIGILVFISSYFYAAHLYPGGQYLNRYSLGYDHIYNFYCDLQDKIAIIGAENPGYGYSIFGSIVLFSFFIPFWYSLPQLFSKKSKVKKQVQICGIGSMVSFLLLPAFHQFAVNAGFILGFLAGALSFRELFKEKYYELFVHLFFAALFCAINYIMWFYQLQYQYVPIIQRFFFIFVFTWIWRSTTKIYLMAQRT